MSKEKKSESKYADLLGYTGPKDERYHNIIFVCDEIKAVVSTCGKRALVRRDVYPELKVLARLAGEDTKALLQNADGLLVRDSAISLPGFNEIMPKQEKLDTEYKRIALTVPKWLGGINKTEEKIYCSIILGDAPIIAIGFGYENSAPIDARFLEEFAGQNVDLYVAKDGKKPFVFLPAGTSYELAPWFALVAPLNVKEVALKPTYQVKNELGAYV